MNFREYLKESDETFVPPESVASAARKAIKWKEKYKDEVKGGTIVGWNRAHQLANRENISLKTVKRMYSFFSRHSGNEDIDHKYKDEPHRDNGYISWLIWGGNAGKKWVEGILRKDK